MSSSDADLLAAWVAGDRRAGDELTRRHYDRVYRFFDLRAANAAEDLTQRTFLQCTESYPRLRDLQSFKSFLFGIARNVLLMHLRRRAVEEKVFEFTGDDQPSPAGPGPTPSRIVALHEEQHLLLRALSTLPLDGQIAIELFYAEGLAVPEIADVLAIPVSTVTTRLSRARTQLRTTIEQMHATEQFRESLLRSLDGWAGSLGTLRPAR